MIHDPKQFVAAINQLAAEKNLPRILILDSIKAAIKTAYKKDHGNKEQEINVNIDEETGIISIFWQRTVVKKSDLENEDQEITLEEAKKYKKDAKVDDIIEIEVTPPSDYRRIAAQAAKQVIMQRLQEAEREILFETFKERENELVSALVSKVDDNIVFLEIEGNLVPLMPEERVGGEKYFPGTRMKVFLNKVVKTTKGPLLLISRKHPDLVRKLFEFEIPEIRNKDIEIKAVARVAGIRSKVAVDSVNDKIDPIGACVGQKGVRIQNIIRELNGEMIDVIAWSKNTEEFIQAALSPAKIERMTVSNKEKRATIYVANDQRPLAIGKQGQNVKLASDLTGFELDIRDIADFILSSDKKEIVPKAEEKDSSHSDIVKDLNSLGLSESVLKKLQKAGIMEITQLEKMSKEDLTKIGGIGKQTADQILEKLYI